VIKSNYKTCIDSISNTRLPFYNSKSGGIMLFHLKSCCVTTSAITSFWKRRRRTGASLIRRALLFWVAVICLHNSIIALSATIKSLREYFPFIWQLINPPPRGLDAGKQSRLEHPISQLIRKRKPVTKNPPVEILFHYWKIQLAFFAYFGFGEWKENLQASPRG
jgi:hypothetical protein